jgi:hypothetical protein
LPRIATLVMPRKLPENVSSVPNFYQFSSVSQEECKKLVNDAANDYASQQRRMSPDLLRGLGDPKLSDCFRMLVARPK